MADAAIELISTAESRLADRGVDWVWAPDAHSLR